MNSVQNWLQIDLCAERSTQKQHNNNIVESEWQEPTEAKYEREMTPQFDECSTQNRETKLSFPVLSRL